MYRNLQSTIIKNECKHPIEINVPFKYISTKFIPLAGDICVCIKDINVYIFDGKSYMFLYKIKN